MDFILVFKMYTNKKYNSIYIYMSIVGTPGIVLQKATYDHYSHTYNILIHTHIRIAG